MCTRFDSEVNSHTSTRKLVTTLASSGWGKGVDPKLFHHVLLCEVKVLIETFLIHRVLGEVKI